MGVPGGAVSRLGDRETGTARMLRPPAGLLGRPCCRFAMIQGPSFRALSVAAVFFAGGDAAPDVPLGLVDSQHGLYL